MKELKGRVAVVTGAASGIGRALASELSRAGCRLALSDINETELEATAAPLRDAGTEVMTRVLDVADRDAVHAHAGEVHEHFGQAHLVINNAGVALGAAVEDMRYEDMEWLMGINFWGVVHGTKAFLPLLREAREGHIVNVSSVFGLVGIPTQSAYNASKFAVRGFTEALRQELDLEDCGVSATCVHPGGIKTNIARSARMTDTSRLTGMGAEEATREFEKMFRTSPEEAARAIVRGVRNNSRRVLIGSDARMIDTMVRSLPTGYQRIVVSGQRFLRNRKK